MTKAERQRLEAWFRAERIAYIDVRPAARAVLPDGYVPTAGPTPFHYVLYADTNMLLWWGKRRPATLRLMARWEDMFGEGFTACFGELPDRDAPPSSMGSDGASLDVLVMLGKRTAGSATGSPTSISLPLPEASLTPPHRTVPPILEQAPTLFPLPIPSSHRERS